MTVKNPYVPPNYGVINTAIDRRIAGKPPASLEEADEKPAKLIAEKPKGKAKKDG